MPSSQSAGMHIQTVDN